MTIATNIGTALLLATLGAGSCGCIEAPSPRSPAASEPRVSRRPLDTDPDAQLDPQLLARVRSNPVGYFRFVNRAFGNEVCRRFGADPDAMRVVNLHGDAHFEQYAVTDTGRGLTDFDDAASGPAVLDLVRFGTSLVLTSRERQWDDSAERMQDEFLRGYRSALRDPSFAAPEPRIVERIRAGFRFDPELYFAWLRSVSDVVSADTSKAITSAFGAYVVAMLGDYPQLDREYFRIQTLGRSRIGIGSARARKYLVRVRGATDSGSDDDVLELKEVAEMAGVDCLSRTSARDPSRLIVAQARIAYEPYGLVGHLVLDGENFWVHAWPRSYHEVAVRELQTVDELAEVAFDVGVQLGLGHPRFIASPFDRELRESELRFLATHETDVRQFSNEMADEVTSSWRRFRVATEASTIR